MVILQQSKEVIQEVLVTSDDTWEDGKCGMLVQDIEQAALVWHN
jgi:hypothetical protein